MTGLLWKLDNTRRLVALGRRFLAEVDVDAIHVADLARFVSTWRTALDDPMSTTARRVDELAALITVRSPMSEG
jgi:hypothetical protein